MAGALYLSEPFAQHALIASALVAVMCGLISPFVVTRGMAFAVHGTSELAFTGAAAGLLIADNALAGALVGALVFASVIGVLGERPRARDSTIGDASLVTGLACSQAATSKAPHTRAAATTPDLIIVSPPLRAVRSAARGQPRPKAAAVARANRLII